MTQNGQENAAAYASGSVTDQSSFVPTSEAERTVARAAAWLDSQVGFVGECGVAWPKDWRDHINPTALNLSLGEFCVIGQPINTLRRDEGLDAIWCGPCSTFGGIDGDDGWETEEAFFDHEQFAEAWIEYVTATRGEANTETSSDLGAKPNNPTSPPTTCGQTRTRSPEVLERVTANV